MTEVVAFFEFFKIDNTFDIVTHPADHDNFLIYIISSNPKLNAQFLLVDSISSTIFFKKFLFSV